MNDNWNEIVDELHPLLGKSTKNEFKIAIESCFRVLGWRKSNGSMLQNLSLTNGGVVDLILTIPQEDGTRKPCFPVFIKKEGNTALIQSAMEEFSVNMAISFGDTVSLYYRADNDAAVKCICDIKYDVSDENGSDVCGLLSSMSFSMDNLEAYFSLLSQSVMPDLILRDEIGRIISNPGRLKDIVAQYLIQQGCIPESTNKALEELRFVVSTKANETLYKKTPSSGTTLDTTKFSLDGQNFMNKKRFVLYIIKKYVEDHPSVTYDDLEKQFPSEIHSKNRGVVRPLSLVKEWMKDNPDVQKRFDMKPNEIINLQDGTQVVVHNQWGTFFPRFLAVAKTLYAPIYSNQPYNEDVIVWGEHQSSPEGIVQESEPGIRISEKSFETFKQRK